jgi:hypothetical protein
MQLALQHNTAVVVAISVGVVVAVIVLALCASILAAWLLATVVSLISLQQILINPPLFICNNAKIEADKLDYIASIYSLTF